MVTVVTEATVFTLFVVATAVPLAIAVRNVVL